MQLRTGDEIPFYMYLKKFYLIPYIIYNKVVNEVATM